MILINVVQKRKSDPTLNKIVHTNLKAALIGVSLPFDGSASYQAENHTDLAKYGLKKLIWLTC